ncbi:MAG: sigma-70 family RNA polymerase sigma factor [Lachnospiraceae bacterium]|nr:sigma-70 family RNA polymerase sigma factor [Lachnospiraceae bacterium]
MKLTNELREALENYKKGNEDAFSTIYEESKGYIYVCIANTLNSDYKNEDVIQDIMQDAYFDISKNISKLNETDDFLNWAATIAKRRTYDFLRKNGKYVLLGEDESFNDLADDNNMLPEEVVLSKEKQEKVREVINTELTEDEKNCVVGYYYNDMKQKDIAKELDMPENTVSSNIFRAKSKMKKALSGVFVVALAACLLIFALNTNAVKEALRKIGYNKEEAQTKETEESSSGRIEEPTEERVENPTVGLMPGYEHHTNDYVYTHYGDTWSVSVKDKTKTSYEEIKSEISYLPVVNMDSTFEGCVNMVTAPKIPFTVKSMNRTFYGCESLTGTVTIDANPDSYDGCFGGTCIDEQNIILSGASSKLSDLKDTSDTKAEAIAKRMLDTYFSYSIYGVCCNWEINYSEELISYMKSQGFNWAEFACKIDCCKNVDEVTADINKYFSENILNTITPVYNGVENLFVYDGNLYMAMSRDEGYFWSEDSVLVVSASDNEIVFEVTKMMYGGIVDSVEVITLTYNGSNYVITDIERIDGFSIPEGCTYYRKSTGETLVAGNFICDKAETGDIYFTKDYEYRYAEGFGWQVVVKDRSKTSYEEIESEILGYPVVDMDYTFQHCYNMVTAPRIPSTVKSMNGTFDDCESLTGTVVIDANPDTYYRCFGYILLDEQNITLSGNSTILEDIKYSQIVLRLVGSMSCYEQFGINCAYSPVILSDDYMQSQGITWTSTVVQIECCNSVDKVNAHIREYISDEVLNKITPYYNGVENLFTDNNGYLYMPIPEQNLDYALNIESFRIISSSDSEIVFEIDKFKLDGELYCTYRCVATYNGTKYVLTELEIQNQE